MNDPVRESAKAMEEAREAYVTAILYHGGVCGGAGDVIGLIHAAATLKALNAPINN